VGRSDHVIPANSETTIILVAFNDIWSPENEVGVFLQPLTAAHPVHRILLSGPVMLS